MATTRKKFEDELKDLEGIVGQIDSGELSLEDSIAAFERGVGLVRSLNQKLDEVERKVELLMRNAQGELTCVSDHPFGFEWCINAPLVDRDGTVYGNSEDGNLYVIDRNGREKTRFFLELALEAAYTPLAIDGRGHLFVLNDGHLSVVGERDDD